MGDFTSWKSKTAVSCGFIFLTSRIGRARKYWGKPYELLVGMACFAGFSTMLSAVHRRYSWQILSALPSTVISYQFFANSSLSKAPSARLKLYSLITSRFGAQYTLSTLITFLVPRNPSNRNISLSMTDCTEGSRRWTDFVEKKGAITARRMRWSSWPFVAKTVVLGPNCLVVQGYFSLRRVVGPT